MSQPERVKEAGGGAVCALLTVLWLSAMAVAAYMVFASAMQGWAASYSGGDEDAAEATIWMYVLCALAVGGPAVIAIVGAANGQKAIAIVMGLLSVILAVPALYLGAAAYESRPKPPPTPFRYEHGCVDRSGGNGECPGG